MTKAELLALADRCEDVSCYHYDGGTIEAELGNAISAVHALRDILTAALRAHAEGLEG